VESSLLRHQAVANCGVVGLGEPGRQAVVAAILLKGSASGTDALAADIKALTIDLPAHQQPQAVVFVAELPTVLGGAKVQREALQQRLSASVLAIAS
jgi:acyl-coenzyme A synthetase/AMP-(fatty) acid ligase